MNTNTYETVVGNNHVLRAFEIALSGHHLIALYGHIRIVRLYSSMFYELVQAVRKQGGSAYEDYLQRYPLTKKNGVTVLLETGEPPSPFEVTGNIGVLVKVPTPHDIRSMMANSRDIPLRVLKDDAERIVKTQNLLRDFGDSRPLYDENARSLLEDACKNMPHLRAGYNYILDVARTLAAMGNDTKRGKLHILPHHMAEAIQYSQLYLLSYTELNFFE